MADPIGTAHQGTASSGQGSARAKFDEAAASTKSLGEQAMSAGRDLTDKAKDIAETSTDAIKGQASDLIDAAKDVASQATDKLKDAVNDRKSSGAEYVGSLANTMRRAAREFDTDLPIAGTYIRKAASQIEGVSDHIRNGNLNDRGSERANLCAPSTDGLPRIGGPGGFWSRSFPQELVRR